MLDQETKRRIDNARQVLVGKIPDPKAQVEQITTALIYKFMDDMDSENVELGGGARFFKGKLEEYKWGKLMSPQNSGHGRIDLYVRALEAFSTSEQIPAIFRRLFKDAFLPYRDAETLNLFLKEINGFTYDHSENLGNAFEYLLSVLGSQGDAGQFRTPRHIIDFIVEVVNPQKNETICDPACGTAGFLISAFKYIRKLNSSNYDQNSDTPTFAQTDNKDITTLQIQSNGRYKGDLLTPDDRTKIARHIEGFDISPDMVNLSLVNLYLHGFPDPKITEYDSLTYEDRWDQLYDVILANPPFMTPKGGIRPHKRFQVQANRAEVLFVDYIAEHLTINGRAGIIVPEGIIFQSSNAYKALRKMLVDDHYLWAVLSLPAGVFNPYSGVKTSVLFLDRQKAKQAEEILFIKASNDGFDLGAQRRRIQHNDLPEAFSILRNWAKGEKQVSKIAHWVAKSQIAESGDYNLTGDRYKVTVDYRNAKWPMVKLGDVCDVFGGGTPSRTEASYWGGTIPWITSKYFTDEHTINGYENITEKGLKDSSSKIAPKDSTIIITRVSVGKYAFADRDYAINQDLTALVPKDKRLNSKFLYLISETLANRIKADATGIGVTGVKREYVTLHEIPLPPLEIQQQIVAEIDGYQKVIDGAQQVVDSWKPIIKVDPAWPMVRLGDVLDFIGSGATPLGGKEVYVHQGVLFIRSQNVLWGQCDFSDAVYIDRETHENMKRSNVQNKDVLFNITGASIGRCAIYLDEKEANVNQHVTILRCSKDLVPPYLMHCMLSKTIQDTIWKVQAGGSRQALNYQQIRDFQIPIPPLETQQQIVAEIEAERQAVDACKTLIAKQKQKIKAKLAEVWGE